jgi:DNA-binding HxlR family transcriptional regulator
VRSYGQYCPIAKSAEILGDRWTLLIVREMSFGVSRFNEMERALPGISRSVLTQRLRHLERVGLVERVAEPGPAAARYRLTRAGQDLKPVLHALGDWAAQWAFGDPDPKELDPDLLMRWISRHVATDRLPGRRVVAEFELSAGRPRRYWLVMEPHEISVCLHDPGFASDVNVAADVAALYKVYLGRLTLEEAIRAGQVTLSGAVTMVRAFPRWFAWSDFAPTVRAAALTR